MDIEVSKTRVTVWAAALLGLSSCGSLAVAAPLFESDETLAILLEFPVNDLLRQAKKKPNVEYYLSLIGVVVVESSFDSWFLLSLP